MDAGGVDDKTAPGNTSAVPKSSVPKAALSLPGFMVVSLFLNFYSFYIQARL
jgi:hypothetical protein